MISLNKIRKISSQHSLKDLSKGFRRVYSNNTKNKQDTTNDVKTQNPESEKPEPIFLSKETKVLAGMHEGKISLNFQVTTKTNSPFFRYDCFKWIEDFIEKISHRNEMEKAQLVVHHLKNQLVNIRQNKIDKELKLVQLRKKLSQFSLERKIELSHENASNNCFRLMAKESDLEDEKRQLVVNIESLNDKEKKLFNEFLIAIENSNEKSYLHSDFLKASIFTCFLLTLILVYSAMYIYYFNLINNLNEQLQQKIQDLNKQQQQKMSSVNKSQQQESWGSYLKGYVRPLYGWVWPKT